PVGETAHIRNIQRKPRAELSTDREIDGVGVGRLQCVIHTPSYRGTSGVQVAWERYGVGPLRRRNKDLIPSVIGGGNRIHGCDPRGGQRSLNIGRIRQLSGKSKRAILIKRVGKALAHAVINDTKSRTDAGLPFAAKKCAE